MSNRLRNTKLLLVLIVGIAFLVLLLFFLPTSVSVDSSDVAATSSDSNFPWIIFVAIIPAILLPVMLTLRKEQGEATHKTRKAKRKPQYIHDASGELLEVIDVDDESSSLDQR